MSFASLSDKVQPVPVKRHLLEWCPTMDLIAIISDSDEISMNRLSGQRVWAITPTFSREQISAPISLSWRPDGKVLAVGFADGSLQCLDLNDGRTIDYLHKPDAEPLSLLQWQEGFYPKRPKGLQHLMLDVRTQLSRLIPIPSSSTERMFSDAESIRTLIHDLEQETDTIRLIASSSDSGDFSVLVGALKLKLINQVDHQIPATVVNHCSTRALDLHALIHKSDTACTLQLYSMDIFVQNEPVVRDMINTFNDFHAVSAYLSEALAYMQEEHNTLLETRSPSFKKLDEAAGSKQLSCDMLFTFLMTGTALPVLADWLEGVNERLIKRWEKSCQVNLENIAKVVHDSCEQACHRLIIMLISFREMSLHKTKQDQTRIETARVDATLKALELLVAQLTFLVEAIHVEIDLFSAFCQWLCYAIARLPEDDETPDAIMPASIRKVATYIDKHYLHNKVSGFFVADEQQVDIKPFLGLEKEVETLDPFPTLTGPNTPTIHQTHDAIKSFSAAMFAEPAQALTRRWHAQETLTLSRHPPTTSIVRFVQTDESTILYTVIVEHEENQGDCLFVIRNTDGKSCSQFEICKVLPVIEDVTSFSIQDVKFIDETELILVLQSTGEDKGSHLLAFEYTALSYTLHTDHSAAITACPGIETRVQPSKHRILETGVHPISLAVNGRKGRRAGLYLQADRQRYTVFDLDDQADDDEDDEEDMQDA